MASPDLPRITLPGPGRVSAELIVAGAFEDGPPVLQGAPKELAAAVERAVDQRSWTGAKERSLRLSAGDGRGVVLLGLGPARELDARGLGGWLRRALAMGREEGVSHLGLWLPEHATTQGVAAASRILRQLLLASYRFETFKQSKDDRALRHLQLVPPAGEESVYRSQMAPANGTAGGVRCARDLGNTPPNVATPRWLASQARSLARRRGMKVRVLALKELAKEGMGGILAVGSGSRNPPRLVRLEWGDSGPSVALVGKGITFDTGGISIKPAADMDEMKFDKCGACTVLGIADAVTRLELPVRLRCYLPLAENMPSGAAYRPSDIVRCYNDTTVEIVNTDAEGRMVLADALAWAVEEKPDRLLEFSTLTGAAVVALGEGAAALYCSDDEMSAGLLRAAEEAGERLWRMPLWPEFAEQMKGNHADLKNSGGRWGGANTAAAFLSRFVGDHPRWAHIDIAGPALSEKPRQATGYGVALTVGWLRRLVEA